MKSIEEILKYRQVSKIAFYLDYYEMIEEMFKNKKYPPHFFEEKKLLEERFEELCSQSKKDNTSDCIVKLK